MFVSPSLYGSRKDMHTRTRPDVAQRKAKLLHQTIIHVRLFFHTHKACRHSASKESIHMKHTHKISTWIYCKLVNHQICKNVISYHSFGVRFRSLLLSFRRLRQSSSLFTIFDYIIFCFIYHLQHYTSLFSHQTLYYCVVVVVVVVVLTHHIRHTQANIKRSTVSRLINAVFTTCFDIMCRDSVVLNVKWVEGANLNCIA